MGGHYKEDHGSDIIPDLPFDTKIVQSCKDWVDRKIWEAIEIKHRMPEINKQHSENNKSKKEYEVDAWTLL